MKRSHISLVSFIALAFASVFVYQNCSKQGFSTVGASSAVSGNLLGMTADGLIQGTVVLENCDSECPEQVPVHLETFDGGGTVGDTVATPVGPDNPETENPQTDNPQTPTTQTYTFSFQVPVSQFQCQVIVVIITDPRTGATYQVPIDKTFAMWGGNPDCGFTITPVINVVNVNQDGPVIYVEGTCTTVPQGVTCTGDTLGVNNSINCVGGHFEYCALLSHPGSNLNITFQQIINGQVSEEQVPFSVNLPPMVIVVVDTLVVNGQTVTVTGRCTPGAILKFNIYNNDVGTVNCVDGTFTFDEPVLVNTTPRILYITQTTPFGITRTIGIDVDQTTVPSCSITTTVGDNFCADSSGSINGTCQKNLPVLIYVDDTLQGVAYCADNGTFSADHVILNNNSGTGGSIVKIEQPIGKAGKSCTDTKAMMSF